MSFRSPARFELVTESATLTLVEVGDLLASPPQFSAEQVLFEADGILAPASFFKPEGGALLSITLSIDQSHANWQLAQLHFLTAGESALMAEATLRITIGDQVTEWPHATVSDVSPEPLPGTRAGTITTYQILAPAVPTL